jgi:hypothetical protein
MKTQKTLTDAQGQQVPIQYVKPYDRARDKAARRILTRFLNASQYLAKVKADTLADIEALQTSTFPEAAHLGGAKGNLQFMSFDGLIRIRTEAKTLIEFDDRFRRAQELIFSYLDDLTGGTNHKDVATIIKAAFKPTAGGMLSRVKVTGLTRLSITHPKWVEAMDIIRECQFVKAGKSYLYCETKASSNDDFEMIPLDIAAIEPADKPVALPMQDACTPTA